VRTTVTLSDEAESLIRAAMAEHGWTFKTALNTAVTRGLAAKARTPFETPAHRIGLRSIPDHRALALAGDLEDVELSRKRDLGK
jgi:hypothetical protein